MNQALSLALMSTILLSGCLAIPVRPAAEKPFQAEDVAFLKMGTSSKSDISESMGWPENSYSNGRWWVYHADRRMTEWFLIICAGYGACGGDTVGGSIQEYKLILAFDDQDVLAGVSVFQGGEKCEQTDQICYTSGFLDVGGNSRQEANTTSDICPLFIYTISRRAKTESTYILLNDMPLKILLSNDHYALFELGPGTHKLVLQGITEKIICNADDGPHFMRLLLDDSSSPVLETVDNPEGSRDLRSRRSALKPDANVQ